MQQARRRRGDLGKKALSVVMSVVLAVGLLPLPAFGNGVVPADTSGGSLTGGGEAVQVDYAAEDAEDGGIAIPDDVAAMDFSTQRVIVSLESGSLDPRDADNVVSEGDGEYLLQYKNEEAAQRAYVRYDGREGVAYVAPDIVMAVADDSGDSEDADATDPTDAPVANLSEDKTAADDDVLKVALVDTGAPEGDSHVVSYRSAIEGGAVYDDHDGQHGTEMLNTMVSESEDIQVVSVKALDENGVGTAATVKEGIEIAVAEGAKVINLSFSGRATESNAAIAAAVDEATEAGAIVIAAAGNDGADASYYTPANAEGSFTVGAAKRDGSRQALSNYGSQVDAYVKATSTSRAAARASGWLFGYLSDSVDLGAWQEALRSSTIAGNWSAEDSYVGDVAKEGDGLVRAAEATIYLVGGKGEELNSSEEWEDSEYPLPSTNYLIDSDYYGWEIPSTRTLVGWVNSADSTLASFPSNHTTVTITEPDENASVGNGTYTFYAVWRETVSFAPRKLPVGSSNSVLYRYFIQDESGNVYGYLTSAPQASSASVTALPSVPDHKDSDDWKTLGWRGSDSAHGWDNGSVASVSDVAGAAGVTQYGEFSWRELEVALGHSGTDQQGYGSTTDKVYVRQFYSGADTTSAYGIDTSYTVTKGPTSYGSLDAASSDWSKYVPKNTSWGFAGFQVFTPGTSTTVSALSVNKPDITSVEALQTTTNSGLQGDYAKYLLAEYVRTVTVNKYVVSGGYYEPEEQPQYYCTMYGGTIAATEPVSDAVFKLENPEGYSVTGWTYNGGNISRNVNASDIGIPLDLNAKESELTTSVVAVSYTKNAWTVHFFDTSEIGEKAATSGKAFSLVNDDESYKFTPTTFNSNYKDNSPGTFVGWADAGSKKSASNPLTAVKSVGSTSSKNGDEWYVQAIWSKKIPLTTGGTTTSQPYAQNLQYFNLTAPKYSLELVSDDVNAPTNWAGAGWSTTQSAVSGTSSLAMNTATGTYSGTAEGLFAVYSKASGAKLSFDINKPSDALGTDPSTPSDVTATEYYVAGMTTATAKFSSLPSLADYSNKKFEGWFTDATGGTKVTTSTDVSFDYSEAATDTKTLYAHWSTKSAGNANYTIKYYLQGFGGDDYSVNTAIQADVTGSGEVGSTASLTADNQLPIKGFAYNDEKTKSVGKTSGTIASGDSLVLEIYYSRNTYTLTPATYQTVAPDLKTWTFTATPQHGFVNTNQVYYGDTVTMSYDQTLGPQQSVTYEGITVTNGTFTMPYNDITSWTATVGQRAYYTTEHYQQQLDGNYSIVAGDTKTDNEGVVGATASIAENTYAGYAVSTKTDVGNVKTGTIAADGSLVLKLYYDLVPYTIKINTAGDSLAGASFTAVGSSGLGGGDNMAVKGDAVTITASGITGGYKVTYSSGDATVNPTTGAFSMPAKNVTITATLTAPDTPVYNYTVEHWRQTLTDTYEHITADDESIGAAEGDVVNATAKTTGEYANFEVNPNADGYLASGTVTSSGLKLKLYYDRKVSKVNVGKATAADGYELEFSSSAARATALGTDEDGKEAAYGDTVTIAPKAKLANGYILSYEVKDAAGNTIPTTALTSSGATTFTMPASAVTVTPKLELDGSYHSVTVTTPHVGVDVSSPLSSAPWRLKEGDLFILIASAQDGFDLPAKIDGNDNLWTVSGTVSNPRNATKAIVFEVGTTDVTLTAPLAQTTLVEQQLDASGAVASTTTTVTTYDGADRKSAVTTGGTTVYTTATDSADGLTTTTYSDAARTTRTAKTVAVDDGEGTVVTTTYGATDADVQGEVTAESVALGSGKTRTYETASPAAAGYPRTTIAETDSTTGVTVATTRQASTPNVTTTGTKGSKDPDNPYVITEEETVKTTVATTSVDGSTTTTQTTAETEVVYKTVTTRPAKNPPAIGGVNYTDGTVTEVYKKVGDVETTQYYRASLDGTGPYTAAYASDDTEVAGADATITETTGLGATIDMKVTPQGSTKASGASTMVATTAGVTSLTAEAGGVTFGLTDRALKSLDPTKYWYSLVVYEESEASLTADDVLGSDEWQKSAETRAYRVEVYRIARDVAGQVAGTVSELSEEETAALGVTLSLGEGQDTRLARASRVDHEALGLNYINTSLVVDLATATYTDSEGNLKLERIGGTGELLVGLGVMRTITYESNFPRTSGKAKVESYGQWSEKDNAKVYTVEECPITLTGWAVETWNERKNGTSTESYVPGESIGDTKATADDPLSADRKLYAQWKWDLKEDFTAAKGYGTKVNLFKADGTAYSATYNGAAQAPAVTVTCADGSSVYSAATPYELPTSSYTVKYEKKYEAAYDAAYANYKDDDDAAWVDLSKVVETDATGASLVKNAGTYRVKVVAVDGGRAASGSYATEEFTIAKAAQTLTLANGNKTAYTYYYGDPAFSIASTAAGVTGGTAAGAVQYPISQNTPNTGVGASKNVVTVTTAGAVTIAGAGKAVVNVTALATQNYAAASKAVTITINRTPRVIQGTKTYSKTYGNAPFQLDGYLYDTVHKKKVTGTENNITWKSDYKNRTPCTATGKLTIGLADGKSGGATATADQTANYAAASAFTVVVKIAKATNALTVKAVKATQKVKRSKKTTLKAAKVFKVTKNKSKGAMTYKIKTVPKKFKKYISVTSAGNVTIKKGAPKGTHKVVFNATSKAKGSYKATTKKVTVKFKVS